MQNNIMDVTVVDEKPLTTIEWKVTELISQGSTRREIADELGLALSEVYTVANRKSVKNKSKELVSDITNEMLAKNIRLLDATIEDKLLQLDENGGRLANSTRKDIVDLLESMNKIGAASKQEAKSNNVVNILNQIMIKE